MKLFLFSGRFLVPFFIMLAGYLVYLTWDLLELYGSDFSNKGLPSSVLTEWVSTSIAGSLLPLSFLLSLLVAITYYSHYYFRQDRKGLRPFSIFNIAALVTVALIGFWYVSFQAPKLELKSRKMLSALIYSRSYKEYQKEIRMPYTELIDEKSKILSRLYEIRDSLKADTVFHVENKVYKSTDERLLKKIDFEINQDITFPFLLILFYIAGTLLAVSFCRAVFIFPLLVSCFVVFTGFYYLQSLLKVYYFNDKINLFFGAGWGLCLSLSILLIIWYLILKSMRLFKPDKNDHISFIKNEPEH
ncbi:MAG TPA: LptF/LptG family permease [Chitinophagaceae bacterium]